MPSIGPRKKSRTAPPNPKCKARVRVKDDNGELVLDDNGEVVKRPCDNHAITGGTVCWTHGGRVPAIRNRAAVVAEVARWGPGDSKVDPGEVLLRLVSQSAARAELYSQLLAEAYDAAERIRTAHEAELLVETDEGEEERAATQVARDDLRRVFNTGGVAALIGNTYDDAKGGGIYATGEAIRGLAQLEAQERDRCANFATKAIAAGLAERQVRLAEKQVQLALGAIEAALEAAGVPAAARGPAKIAAARHLQLVG